MSHRMTWPEKVRSGLRTADALGRALVTQINGRIVIILPPMSSDDETTRQVARIAEFLGKNDAN